MAKHMRELLAENSLATDSDLRTYLDLISFVKSLDKEFSCTENYPKGK